MNIENMTKLRDHLVWLRDNKKSYKFNMAYWLGLKEVTEDEGNYSWSDFSHGSLNDLSDTIKRLGFSYKPSPYECNTVACLAGHTAMILGAAPGDDVETFAQEALGLESSQAEDLFLGFWSDKPRPVITIGEAITHLSTLIADNA